MKQVFLNLLAYSLLVFYCSLSCMIALSEKNWKLLKTLNWIKKVSHNILHVMMWGVCERSEIIFCFENVRVINLNYMINVKLMGWVVSFCLQFRFYKLQGSTCSASFILIFIICSRLFDIGIVHWQFLPANTPAIFENS